MVRGPALVRVVARGRRARVVPQRVGFGRLVVGAPGRKSARELSKGWHRGLDWGEGGIVCVRSGAVTPSQIVVLAANGSGRRAVARGPVGGFEATGLVEPRPVMWKSGGATVHGLLWRPAESAGPLPTVVHVHGGPTGQALADWNPRVQWFVQQGYAVLQPNYRGSTGYGVAYRNALDGRWGELDVADVAAGIKHAVKEGWARPGRVALMGGSAGGFTALNVAAQHPDLVAGVVALFPVTDLLDLAATTHRFESGYTARLVGPLPDARATYDARSPIANTAGSALPVLLLQGEDDRVVNAERTAAFAAALTRAGAAVEHHMYDGEGHGWRRSATVADELERIDVFLRAMVLTDLAYQGPKRGADRAVLLAHGAGADMHAATLTTVADALAAAGVPSLRFNFPYRAAGRKAPDRAPVLEAAVREAAAELARRAKLPPERLVLGGRSMGGRICSMVAADRPPESADANDLTRVLGLVLLGYPLHPPGSPDKLRVEHFPRVRMPVLFVSGTRDAFGTPAELKSTPRS